MQLTREEKFHYDNWMMVKRWGKWPAEWRGCGWRMYQVNVINELEGLFQKARQRDRQMAEQGESVRTDGKSKVITSHGF